MLPRVREARTLIRVKGTVREVMVEGGKGGRDLMTPSRPSTLPLLW